MVEEELKIANAKLVKLTASVDAAQEEEEQSSDCEDYSALRKAAAAKGRLGCREREGNVGNGGFEVVPVKSASMTPSHDSKRQAKGRGSRPETKKLYGHKDPWTPSLQMEDIDESWLTSVAMR
jgi:hypothetical protein